MHPTALLNLHLEAHDERVQRVHRILKIVTSTRPVRQADGRLALDTAGILYWPAIERLPALLRGLCGLTVIGDEVPSVKDTRDSVERDLGPLLLNPRMSCGQIFTDYAYRERQFLLEDLGEVPDVLEQRLFDPSNYTVFRRVNMRDSALLRPFVPPPPPLEVRPFFASLPSALAALYAAWYALHTRHEDPFDGQEVGLDFVENGYMFINWRRFRNSRFWPSSVQLSGELVDEALRHLKGRLSLVNGMLPKVRHVRTKETPSQRRKREAELAYYYTLCQKTDAFNFNMDTPSQSDPATIIDPLYLRRKAHLFDGRWHMTRDAHGKLKVRTSRVKRTARQRFANTYPVTFRPMDWLEKYTFTDEELWFPKDHEETIHIVSRKGQPFYTYPRLLSTKNPAGASDTRAWLAAVDSLKLVENFFEDGSMGNVQEQSRGDYLRKIRDEHLYELGHHIIKNFAFPDHNSREFQRLKVKAAQTHEEGTRWYYEVLKEHTNRLRIHDVRRILEVNIPEFKQEPYKEHFWSRTAIDVFHKFAMASAGMVDPEDADSPVFLQYLKHLSKPAPYLLAWTLFCRRTELPMKMSPSDDRSRHWTPDEDLFLIKSYSILPRLKKEAWRNICMQLERNKPPCHARIKKLNTMLQRALVPMAFNTYKVGTIRGDELKAKRVVMLMGVVKVLQQNGERMTNHSHPAVAAIMALTNSQLANMPLPPRYDHPLFHAF